MWAVGLFLGGVNSSLRCDFMALGVHIRVLMQTITFLALLLVASFTHAASADGQLSAETQKRIHALVGMKTASGGANCWNAALLVNGNYPFIMHLSDNHATQIFENSCTKIKSTIEEAPIGSVIRYRVNGAETHAFVKYSDTQYFQKFDNSGPYEITSLDKINQTYGAKNYSENQNWSYQVLHCPGKKEPLQDEFAGVLYGFSQMVAGHLTVEQVRPPLNKLMDSIRHRATQLIRSLSQEDAKTLTYFLIDLAQTNTFLTYGAFASSPQQTTTLIQEVDRFIWEMFTIILKEKNIDAKALDDVFNYLYNSTSSSSSPEILVGLYIDRLSEIEQRSEVILASRLYIYSSSSVDFPEASSYVEKAFAQINKTPNYDITAALGIYLRFSKSSYAEKDEQRKRYVEIVLKHSELVKEVGVGTTDVILRGNFSNTEKKTMIDNLLKVSDDALKNEIDIQYGPSLRAL